MLRAKKNAGVRSCSRIGSNGLWKVRSIVLSWSCSKVRDRCELSKREIKTAKFPKAMEFFALITPSCPLPGQAGCLYKPGVKPTAASTVRSLDNSTSC